jgi:hypothetical protein
LPPENELFTSTPASLAHRLPAWTNVPVLCLAPCSSSALPTSAYTSFGHLMRSRLPTGAYSSPSPCRTASTMASAARYCTKTSPEAQLSGSSSTVENCRQPRGEIQAFLPRPRPETCCVARIVRPDGAHLRKPGFLGARERCQRNDLHDQIRNVRTCPAASAYSSPPRRT